MFTEDIYTLSLPYREDMAVKGFRFGKGEKSACIIGPMRGNGVQQMYICAGLVKALKELEAKGCINSGREVMVIPVVNSYSMNIGMRFFGVESADIRRQFPGREWGDAAERLAAAVFGRVQDYSFGIQLTSFHMAGDSVPHIRMIENGYQNASLANLFGLPFVVVRKPQPIDTKTLNYNWQSRKTAAFSLYTNNNESVDEESAKQAVAAILRFLTRMGVIRYESHSGYISHVLTEKDLTDVNTMCGGIFRRKAKVGQEIRYGNAIAEIIDPYNGNIKETILAPTDGIVFFAHSESLIAEGDVAYQLVHRLHE